MTRQYYGPMGLFDKRPTSGKRKDEFDSPVEQIDLSQAAPPAAEIPPATAAATTAATTATAASKGGSSSAEAARPRPAPRPAMPDELDYGIEKAIELMRTLPQGNVELVVQVVKLALESAQIRIGTIIDDASARQERIQSRIGVLRSEISELELEINQRRTEIGTLEADFSETSTVKERLQLAEKLTQSSAPAPARTDGGRDGGGDAAPRANRQTGQQQPAVSASASSAPAGTKPAAVSAPAASTSPAAAAPGNVKK